MGHLEKYGHEGMNHTKKNTGLFKFHKNEYFFMVMDCDVLHFLHITYQPSTMLFNIIVYCNSSID